MDENSSATEAIRANMSTAGTFTMLGWIDPVGQWWIAPLGTPPPDLDSPMPSAWIPVKRSENVR